MDGNPPDLSFITVGVGGKYPAESRGAGQQQIRERFVEGQEKFWRGLVGQGAGGRREEPYIPRYASLMSDEPFFSYAVPWAFIWPPCIL
jgi:hypothetical protein